MAVESRQMPVEAYLAFDEASEIQQEFIILDQERVFARWNPRTEGGWHLWQFTDPADEIELAPLGCALRLADVYHGVNLKA